ncbi:MAG: hypothetical protein P2A85_28195 [Microcoleus anatoxicus]|uniref:hypothetical protein n=1 Tax=Microcoleus anatoxicus TaxID=2705319 RepID=UPI00366D636E
MTNSLLEQLKQASLQRIDGRWQLLATAAGHEESIYQTLESLDVNELRLDSIRALPASLVGDRIMALSVSQPHLIGDLLSEWEKEPRTGDPCIDAGCLNAAINTGRRFLTVENPGGKNLATLAIDKANPKIAANIFATGGNPLGLTVAQKPPSFKAQIEKLLKAGAIG